MLQVPYPSSPHFMALERGRENVSLIHRPGRTELIPACLVRLLRQARSCWLVLAPFVIYRNTSALLLQHSSVAYGDRHLGNCLHTNHGLANYRTGASGFRCSFQTPCTQIPGYFWNGQATVADRIGAGMVRQNISSRSTRARVQSSHH